MISGAVVFYKIATTCLLILVGYIVRRMKLLPEISVSVISKYIMYAALPSYIVYYMPATISMETLGQYWYYPLIGVALMGGSDLFGYIAGRFLAKPGDLGTYRLLVGLPNWVFMALAVCEPMFGEIGIRVVLLYNVGIMFYVWSFGMTSFRSGVGLAEMLKHLFLNMQSIANVAGFALAIFFPILKGMEKLTSPELAALPFYIGVVTPFWETIYLLGATALPLSIVQIGVLLGAPKEPGLEFRRDNRTVVGTLLLRLLAAPALSIGLLIVMCRLGLNFTHDEFVISAIVMSMPAAVLCITISEVYGGNSVLAARAVLWMTFASLLTAPGMTWLAVHAYGWV